MSFLKVFVIFVIYLFTEKARSQSGFESPCPRLFVYEGNKNEPDKWYGIVTLLSETDLSGIWLRLILDKPSLQLGNWFGEVATTDNKEYLIKNRNFRLKANVPQTVQFYIKYNPNEPIPKLISFRLNARTVCPEGLTTETPPVTMQLQTSNSLGSDSVTTSRTNQVTNNGIGGSAGVDQGGGGFPWNQGLTPSGDDEFYPGDFSFFNRPNQQQTPVDNIDINKICGTVVTKPRLKRQTYYAFPNPYTTDQNQYYNYYNNIPHHHGISNRGLSLVRDIVSFLFKDGNGKFEVESLQAQPRPLITYGQETHEGQFPWHVALYHAKGIDLAYICGASLVSRYHVLTVAHCVTLRRSQRPLNPENLVVYLGKFYLKRFSSPGIQDRTVAHITPHPQYSPQTYGNDIAVIKLTTPADITDYVRPVCLWQESPDLNTVLSKQGNVVGWGFDETGKVTEHLMQAKMPVVSQETCIFSFPDFYSRFTSSNTYCAGFRNGTSVCNGDSGGGMVFPKADSNQRNPRWQLRGLVSISVALQNQFKCDASHYVVFTDTAKYLDWIKKSMK